MTAGDESTVLHRNRLCQFRTRVCEGPKSCFSVTQREVLLFAAVNRSVRRSVCEFRAATAAAWGCSTTRRTMPLAKVFACRTYADMRCATQPSVARFLLRSAPRSQHIHTSGSDCCLQAGLQAIHKRPSVTSAKPCNPQPRTPPPPAAASSAADALSCPCPDTTWRRCNCSWAASRLLTQQRQ